MLRICCGTMCCNLGDTAILGDVTATRSSSRLAGLLILNGGVGPVRTVTAQPCWQSGRVPNLRYSAAGTPRQTPTVKSVVNASMRARRGINSVSCKSWE